MNRKLNKKGFTLIEVVLVLAIGGLIFLLAFLAFQQVSKNRRDTQRRSDAGRVIAELQNYAGDHSGSYPTNVDNFLAGETTDNFNRFMMVYMGGPNFKDPSGNTYLAQVITDTMTVPQSSSGITWWPISYRSGGICNGTDFATGQSNNVAVRIKLESGVVCRDNR